MSKTIARYMNGIDFESLLLIHRQPDSYMRIGYRDLQAFVLDECRDIKPLQSVTPSDLSRRNKYRISLQAESFVSLNGFYRDATGKESDLRYLNAAHLDLDCYSITPAERRRELLRLVDIKVLPEPSILIEGGPGLWPIWLLDHRGSPPEAWPENRADLKEINRTLVSRVEMTAPHLLPDASATDLTRYIRIAGSLSLRNHTYVRYTVLGGAHTLDSLRRDLGMGRIRTSWRHETSNRVPNRRSGYLRLHELRLQDLRALRNSRCGFHDIPGRSRVREFACYILSQTHLSLGTPRSEIMDELRETAATCRPPLSIDTVIVQLESAERDRGRRFKNRTLATKLGIAREEAHYIGLTQIRPDFVPQGREHSGRFEQTALRRSALSHILRDHDEGLTSRELASMLHRDFPGVAHTTVIRDLRAMGHELDS